MKNKMILLGLIVLLCSCVVEKTKPHHAFASVVKIADFSQNTCALKVGESLDVNFSILNDTKYPVFIENADVIFYDLTSGASNCIRKNVVNQLTIASGEKSSRLSIGDLYKVSDESLENHFCKLALRVNYGKNTRNEVPLGNFRILSDNSLVTYKIEKNNYEGLPVYVQTGDMSAGFSVCRSLMGLTNGMGGTYLFTNGGGPHPVYATPDFLQKSIKYTLDLYNNEVGPNTKIPTVVLGTGTTPVNYLIQSTQAAFLPIHFLVSCNSTKEIRDILSYSSQEGIPAFSTLGYDGSMPGVGVAWIKMLSLPDEYIKFIKDHQVENVIIFGMDEDVVAETHARKVIRYPSESDTGYEDGTLYILYTNYGSVDDIAAIKNRILDYDELQLGKDHNICDWESGIIQEQIDNMAKSIKENSTSKVYLMNSPSDINLSMYNLASALHLMWMVKNNIHPVGFILNEYLTCYPEYELAKGWVPLIYWQFNSPSSTVERLNFLNNSISKLFPTIPDSYGDKLGYLNSNYNKDQLYSEMLKLGFRSNNLKIRQTSDHWNPNDDNYGVQKINMSAVEEFSYDIVKNIGLGTYRNKQDSYLPLGVTDLVKVKEHMTTSGMDIIFKEL